MMALVLTVVFLVAIFFVAKYSPFMAGILAVFPIRILFAIYEASKNDAMVQTLNGLIAGQSFVLLCLLLLYAITKGVL